MREIRQSGSEGGGIGHTDPPYPYLTRIEFAKDAIPVSKHPMDMAGSSPAMTGVGGACSTSTAKAFGISHRPRTTSLSGAIP